MFPEDIQTMAEAVVAASIRRGVMLATVESCTGGLVAGALTAVPGSSAALDRGFVTYSNEAKTDLVGVPVALIDQHGAVSAEVAKSMAEGAVAKSRAGLAVSVTGVAGPGGGSPEKPVGLVHFATADANDIVHVAEHYGDLGRETVRLHSVRTALRMLLVRLEA